MCQFDFNRSSDMALESRQDNKNLIKRYVQLVVDIEDITLWREDMNFIFEWQKNILRTSAASE